MEAKRRSPSGQAEDQAAVGTWPASKLPASQLSTRLGSAMGGLSPIEMRGEFVFPIRPLSCRELLATP